MAGVPNITKNDKWLIVPVQPKMAQMLPSKFELNIQGKWLNVIFISHKCGKSDFIH